MNESDFKRQVIEKLRNTFPGCEIIRGDSSSQQGIPDHFILWGPYWASLEFKKSSASPHQSNQDYYIEKLDEMSFAAYIYPENEEEVLCALEQAFKPPRRTRVSESKPISLDPLHT
jgi:hypothetical protein